MAEPSTPQTAGRGWTVTTIILAAALGVVVGIYFTSITPDLGSVIIGALLLLAVLTNDSFRRMALGYSSRKSTKSKE